MPNPFGFCIARPRPEHHGCQPGDKRRGRYVTSCEIGETHFLHYLGQPEHSSIRAKQHTEDHESKCENAWISQCGQKVVAMRALLSAEPRSDDRLLFGVQPRCINWGIGQHLEYSKSKNAGGK